jgi:acetamidase/formamidase
MNTKTALLKLIVLLAMPNLLAAQSAPTITYIPKHEELVYTFGGYPAKMHLTPGTTLITWTEDCYDGAVKSPNEIPTKVIPPGHDNPQTGPFYIDGAEPGDALAVHIIKLEPAREYAISSSFPGFGALTATSYTALLHEPLEETVWFYKVDKAKNTVRYQALKGNHAVDLPMRPFLGCIGVAPAAGEVRTTIVPEAFGGNMDTWQACAGATVYLPVNVPGALFSIGDGHLGEGSGEIIGTAVESAMNVTLKIELIKNAHLSWPRLENDEYIMSAGSYRPLEDAARIAYNDIVRWIAANYKMDLQDAYQLVSQTADADLTQMVDPNYTVVVKVPKKYLPAGEVMNGMHQKMRVK